MIKMFLITGAGGFLGSGLRYVAQRVITSYFPISFPFGTLFVNISGCFLVGIIFALAVKTEMMSPELRMFLAIGFCGGFTTFSSFSLDAFGLLIDGAYLYFLLYLTASILLCLAATITGIWIIKAI